MPQILKDELRKRIIDAARNEFSINGISGSSMREISKKANTPVGNIYKYYKNKHDLVNAVLSPLLTKLNKYDFRLLNDNTLLNSEAISEFLINWTNNIVELQSIFPIEMKIIINDEQINREYKNEFIELITSVVFITRRAGAEKSERLRIISRMIAKSIFSGIREGVSLKCSSNISEEDFKNIMHSYMRNAFYMVENID